MEFFHRNNLNDSDAQTQPEDHVEQANIEAEGTAESQQEAPQFAPPAPTPELIVPPVDNLPEEELEDSESRDWRAIGLQVLAAVIVLAIIVFGGRWLHHELSHNNKTANAPTTAQNQNASNKKQATSSPSNSGSGSSNQNSASGSPQTTTPGTTNMPNTGPGNDLALFLAVSFVAASLHYVRSLRRD